jgi:hypothetical protein
MTDTLAALREEWEHDWTHIMCDAKATEEFIERLFAWAEAAELVWPDPPQATIGSRRTRTRCLSRNVSR